MLKKYMNIFSDYLRSLTWWMSVDFFPQPPQQPMVVVWKRKASKWKVSCACKKDMYLFSPRMSWILLLVSGLLAYNSDKLYALKRIYWWQVEYIGHILLWKWKWFILLE